MKKNDDVWKILYLNKEECIYCISLSILLYLFVFIAFNDFPDNRDSIISIIYLIGACTVVLLSQSILSIYGRSYYKEIIYIYMIIAMVNIFMIIPTDIVKVKCLVVMRKSIFLTSMYLLMMSITIEKLNEYFNNKYSDYRMLKINIASLLCFLINYFFIEFLHMPKILIVSNLLVLLIIYKNIKEFKKYKIRIGNGVNCILLLLTMFSVIATFNIADIITNYRYVYIKEINKAIVFMSYILYLLIIIKKLLNRPYRILFSDLYKENLEMDILNGKVVKKNRELEFSQAVIRKKEKMFKTFFISVPIPLVIILKNGRIIFANSSFLNLIEEDNIKSVINKKIFNIISVKHESNVDKILQNKKTIITGSIFIDKKERYVDMEFLDISENTNEVLIILNDVTSRVKIGKLRTEMENNRFQEKIKSDFLSNISHDLKTPINVIYSAAQLVTMFIKNNNKEALKKYNLVSKLNCLALIRLTNNLIDSSRIYSDYLSANLQVKNIVEIVEETVTSLVDYAKSKNIELVFDTDEEEIYTKIDDEFMQRIIINLVSNAIKFTSEMGRIEVIIHNTNEFVELSVKDNGVGMEREFIEKAFKRYSMGKNNEGKYTNHEKGTGIGLFVVKKLVEKQNGTIKIFSEVNKGTNVEMKFFKEI